MHFKCFSQFIYLFFSFIEEYLACHKSHPLKEYSSALCLITHFRRKVTCHLKRQVALEGFQRKPAVPCLVSPPFLIPTLTFSGSFFWLFKSIFLSNNSLRRLVLFQFLRFSHWLLWKVRIWHRLPESES